MKKFIFALFVCTLYYSCSKKEGCTDPSATNYDQQAEKSCADCCTFSMAPSLKEQREALLTNTPKWYWRASTLLSYSCQTDQLTDSSTNNISNSQSYMVFNQDQTGNFNNVVVNTPFTWSLSETGTVLTRVYTSNNDTSFYDINMLNDTILSITASSSWCAQFGEYYVQTEVLKTDTL